MTAWRPIKECTASGGYLLFKKGCCWPLPAFRESDGFWRMLAAPRPFVAWSPNKYPEDYEFQHLPERPA